MTLLPGLVQTCRRAAWKAGLIADRTQSAARHVERLLDTRGQELFDRSGVPGLVVIVRFGEGRTITRCFGVSGGAVPIGVDTVVPALSISKPVTALCAMALVERKTLALDEGVFRRIRSFRFPAHRTGGFDLDGMTLRRLLSHSAGLAPRVHGWCEVGTAPTAKELLEQERDETQTLRLVQPAGTTLLYSGDGYALVEQLIQDVTGHPFPVVAREHVLGPLGMDGSSYDLGPELAARLATPHDAQGSAMPQRRQSSTAAAGLYSTAKDLTTFLAAFAPGPADEPPGRGLISPTTCREMLTPQIVDPNGKQVGLGLYLREKRSDLRYTHLGRYAGWNHHVEGLLRRRVVITAMSNGDQGKECVPTLVHELRKTLYDHAL